MRHVIKYAQKNPGSYEVLDFGSPCGKYCVSRSMINENKNSMLKAKINIKKFLILVK